MKKGLLWSIATMLIGAAGSLTVTPLLIHALGATEFGLYVLILTVASYAGFFDLGLTWAATRYFARDIGSGDLARLSDRFRTLEFFLLAVSVSCLLMAVSCGPALMRVAGAGSEHHLASNLGLGAISFGLALETQLHVSMLRAAQQFAAAGRAAAVGSLILPIASYAVARFAPELTSLLLVNAAVNVVVLVLYKRSSKYLLASKSSALHPRLELLFEMAAFGGWSSLSRVVMIIMLDVDRLAVAVLGSVSGLTYYAVADNLASRVNVVGAPAASLFFARASALVAKQDHQALTREHGRAVRFLMWAGLALALPLITLGRDFLRVWIGPEMAAQGSSILISLTIGYATISIASVDAVTIEASGGVKFTACNMLFWSVLATAYALLFVGHYGSAVIAYTVSGWLILVGTTNMIVSRRTVVVGSHFPWFGAIAIPWLAMLLGLLLRPYIVSTLTGLLLMSVIGSAIAVVGFFIVLKSEERDECLSMLNRLRVVSRRGPLGLNYHES